MNEEETKIYRIEGKDKYKKKIKNDRGNNESFFLC